MLGTTPELFPAGFPLGSEMGRGLDTSLLVTHHLSTFCNSDLPFSWSRELCI